MSEVYIRRVGEVGFFLKDVVEISFEFDKGYVRITQVTIDEVFVSDYIIKSLEAFDVTGV